MDQMDWIEKITGVIASLLSSQSPDQRLLTSPTCSSHHRTASDSSFGSSSDLEHLILEESSLERNCTGHLERSTRNSQQRFNPKHEKPIDVLRKVCGNHICADCGASEPDWASLNLGILVCIECSGVHRNLGVHISKVRSLTLDVRVWEPSVINLFQSLGNAFVNTIWEELLPSVNNGKPEETSSPRCHKFDRHHQQHPCTGKPKPTDPIAVKEKFIQAKYAEKLFVRKSKVDQDHLLMAKHMWDSVQSNDKRAVYRDIVASNADVNTVYGQVSFSPSLTLAKAMLLQEQPNIVMDSSSSCLAGDSLSEVSAVNLLSPVSSSEMDEVVEGFSLLHVACQTADVGMIELLLQYGASVNCIDSEGKTPLHHCILRNRNVFARLLLSRGADPTISDKNGKTPLQYVMESGGIEDEEIIVLLQDTNS